MKDKIIKIVKWIALGVAGYFFGPFILMKVTSYAVSFPPPDFIMNFYKTEEFDRRTVFLMMDGPTRVFPLAIIFICIGALVGRFYHFLAVLLVVVPVTFYSYFFASVNFVGDSKDYLYYAPEFISLAVLPVISAYICHRYVKKKLNTGGER